MDSDLIKKILTFRDDRNWKQYHNEKDLAISMSIEVSELLECFQWMSSEEAVLKRKDKILEELADVFIYGVLLADGLNVNIDEIVKNKLKLNDIKYPVEKSFGKKEKYTDL